MLVESRYALIAACMAHVEGYYSSVSRSFRNNNPGNIEDYKGNTYLVVDKPFIKYPTKLIGFEELVRDIGLNAGVTIKAFIAKYAPPNENNTSTYLEEVCLLSGELPDNIL